MYIVYTWLLSCHEEDQIKVLLCENYNLLHNQLVNARVLALMKNINDNALALMFKMVNEYCNIINTPKPRYSKPLFSKYLNLVNKLQLPFRPSI